MLAAMLTLMACGDAGFEYSSFHPNFTFHNDTHQNMALATAMDAMSTGVFCKISCQQRGGAYYFVCQNNRDLTSPPDVFNAGDLQLGSQNRLGMNNGLIVGYSAYGEGFMAYDAQCPDCFDYNALPVKSYPLEISFTGTATCNRCHRTFDMNTRGCGLTAYRASTSGAFGILHVY
ncbi:MAG: hypothetical protein IJ196_01515 [Prevotella sp.]|nr:hypothetical protein [Prevotella sp.]